GEEASKLLQAIATHDSKASAGYYLKQARQYLSDLRSSLAEISRVCKIGSVATFVVQDSYYKDVPIRLADICESELRLLGWGDAIKQPFVVRRSLTSLNRAAQLYTKGQVNETVLTVRRES
ncbi:hypothetical protein WDZ92_51110, partial [Nostoc sp. NIES-2111]